ncbi:MAG: hypothetical protein Gaeavirus7_3 [Gaeavirus sp.]|uniref:JmjC domain-containing protein n=1 Tax=Gaeavirus sp. TaxID=2487767 RepID=A0A3G4ZYN6_9VIRU|nr:MAG: hypothetical protein Gaeavirus7_3 [Gaeavirus sp.]
MVQYYILEMLYSNTAPSEESDNYKKNISDILYDKKTGLEDTISVPIEDKCKLSKVRTYDYHDIKDRLNEKYFSDITNGHTIPVLFKNVFSENELAQFSYESIIKNHGDVVVEAISSDKHNYGDETLKITFKDYIKEINSGKKYYLTVNNSLANALNISEQDKFYKTIFDDTKAGIKNMFVGNRHSFTHLHSELSASCALQLYGIKKWYLIDPEYSSYLHSITDKDNIYHMAAYGFSMNNEIDGIPRYEIICEQGDFLFVPPWFWHETLNLTDNNVMFSFRPALFVAPYKTNHLYTLMGLKNSLGFNDLTFPYLVKHGLVDPEKDTVIQSIKQIHNRVPSKLMIKK